uniref:Uncharacterized protein n=1 Tax=viral metagenome TaxID=1070528 RepID=A0A6M3L920_9ZZZZ
MSNFLKKYWFNILFGVALIIGVGVAHWSFNSLVEPSSPYMIVDKNEPSDYSPVGYEPVEMTGKSFEQGEKVMVSCKVPESYAPYVHYPQNWEGNVMNPDAWQGIALKYGLYSVLVILVCFIIWRVVVIIRKGKVSNENN